MTRFETITTAQPGAWMEALGGAACHDFYHLPQYHVLAEQRGEGEARLFHYTEGPYSIALPLLLRRPARQCVFAQAGLAGWQDATSVYGYAGPVCSHDEVPEAVGRNFRSALEDALRGLRVVTVFSRLHPFFPQSALLAGVGECPQVSRTVSIDLTVPAEVQRSHFRQNYRTKINRLRRLGITCVHDRAGAYLDDFGRIYEETMRRVGATAAYRFPPGYFEQLWLALGPRLQLFVCLQQSRPICAGLFGICEGIVQYHLGGTRDEALPLSPMRLLLDETRLWATDQGFRVLHLGGGVTSRPDDPLLHFKLGFSDRTHLFSVWRWVLFPDAYQQLCRHKTLWNERHGVRPASDFFPAYRSPTLPCAAPAAAALQPEEIA